MGAACAPGFTPGNSAMASTRSTAARYRRRFARGFDFLFAALIALHLLPIWSVAHFPSQDGPNHLYSADILRRYGGPEGELARRFYTINPRPNPNWLSHAALAGLLTALPPAAAEKALLSLYVVLLALGARFAAGSARAGGGAWALLVFPFVYNWPLHMGFYNFALSLAVMLLTVGAWMRCTADPRPWRLAALAPLLLTLYFCHLVTFAMTLLALGALLGWLAFYERRERRRGAAKEESGKALAQEGGALRRLALITAGAALPALALAALFFGGDSDVGGRTLLFFHPRKLQYLFTLETALFTFRVNELFFAVGLTAGLLAAGAATLAWRARRDRLRRWDGWALVGLLWLAAYLLAPPNIGKGTYLYHRLALFPFLALMLWLAAGRSPRLARLGARTLAVGFALILLLFYGQRYAEGQEGLAEYLSAARAVPPHSVILPVCLSPRGMLPDGRPYAVQIQPFVHASSLVALARGGIDLGDYEGQTAHFPTRFRPELNPGRWMPRGPDPAAYEAGARVRVDAVLVWEDARERLENPKYAALAGQLHRNYRLAYVSPGRGWMKVFLRN